MNTTSSPVRTFIGLGSNLEDPLDQVRRALQELAGLEDCQLTCHSSLYRSDPVGPPGQPDYINAVAELKTLLPAHELLDRMQAIEQAHRRVRKQHWGPRTLDLDLLLYGEEVIDSERLQVPHPFIRERSFVLYPLAEIAPDLVFPDGFRLSGLLTRCPMGTLERLAL